LLEGQAPEVLEGLTSESLEQLALAARASRPAESRLATGVEELPSDAIDRFESEIETYLIAISRVEATRAMRVVMALADRVRVPSSSSASNCR